MRNKYCKSYTVLFHGINPRWNNVPVGVSSSSTCTRICSCAIDTVASCLTLYSNTVQGLQSSGSDDSPPRLGANRGKPESAYPGGCLWHYGLRQTNTSASTCWCETCDRESWVRPECRLPPVIPLLAVKYVCRRTVDATGYNLFRTFPSARRKILGVVRRWRVVLWLT